MYYKIIEMQIYISIAYICMPSVSIVNEWSYKSMDQGSNYIDIALQSDDVLM